MPTKRKEKKQDGDCARIQSYIEQIPDATPHETAAVRPLTPHL